MILRSSIDNKFLFAFAVLTVIGILYSTFLLSLTMFGLIILSQLSINQESAKLTVSWSAKGSSIGGLFRSNKYLFMISMLFFAVLLSFFNSENTEEWYKVAVLKLPFLVVPICMLFYPDFSFEDRRNIFLMLAGVLVVSSIPVLIEYGLHYEAYTERLGKGIPIPTPLNHIKYSLLIALVACGLIVLMIDKRYRLTGYNWAKIFAMVSFGWLFILTHILAVRTGILTLYVGLAVVMVFMGLQDKKYRKWMVSSFFTMALIGFAAFKFVPSVNKKIGYTLYDIGKYQELKDASNYSLAARLYSYDAGLRLLKSSRIVGVGAGDVKAEMHRVYTDVLDISKGADYPHNQYLLTAVRMGHLGLLIFLIAIYGPWIRAPYRADLMICVFISVMTVAFMVDNILERASSVAYFIYLYVLLLKTRYT